MKFIKTEVIIKKQDNIILPEVFKLLKLVTILLLSFCYYTGKSQTDSIFSFFVAGHAYGAHTGINIGLHPPFIKKLDENHDSVMGLFLTGDIVNQSTNESWKQVELELSAFGFKSFYVMGNHDNNPVGHAVFNKKHGGVFYSFNFKNELFIILNSTESDRSISQAQLKYLDDLLSSTNETTKRVFIFFHEVIWNSNIKYKLVKSNSRSRYDQMVKVSNFWSEVYPRLTAKYDKKFFLFAGDVGGNTDAIAALYDRWENVTLISSGMGEVKDENYIKVNVLPDTVTFQLIPLNEGIEMKPITWYNIPEKPDSIIGPDLIQPAQSGVIYRVSPVFNAVNYRWNLSSGIIGKSDSSQITLQFDDQFKTGAISVTAVNIGFGESEPTELKIKTEDNTFVETTSGISKIEILQGQNYIVMNFISAQYQKVTVKIFDCLGRLVFNEIVSLESGFSSKSINKNVFEEGLFIATFKTENELVTKKIMLFK